MSGKALAADFSWGPKTSKEGPVANAIRLTYHLVGGPAALRAFFYQTTTYGTSFRNGSA
jgi:hypothetical protein